MQPKTRIENVWKVKRTSNREELAQICNMNAPQPSDAIKCTKVEKKKAIASLIFLTENREGTIKARQFADGRK